MKTKITLLGVYALFVVIAFFQWREANLMIETQRRAIEAYARVAKDASASSNPIESARLAKAAGGEAWAGFYMAERDRLFVLLSVALTLPVAAYLGASILRKEKA